MFSSVRQGTTIYVLEHDKANGKLPVLTVGQVASFSAPYNKFNSSTPGIGMGITSEKVIDIKVKSGEQEYEFKQLPCDQSVSNYGIAVISDSREGMLSEVDAVKAVSEAELSRTDYNNKVVSTCEGFFKTLNPSYAKDKERDEAIQNLNERFDNLEQNMSKWFASIEKSLSKGGNAKS